MQQYNKGAKLGTLRSSAASPSASEDRSAPARHSGTGYLKNYNYDTRLRFSPPPFFLDPVGSGWGQKTYGEVKPLY